MKKVLLSFLFILSFCLVSYGQIPKSYDTKYFTCYDYSSKLDSKSIYLYEKGNVERPFPLDRYGNISKWKELFKYIAQIVKKEFPTIDDEMMASISKTHVTFNYDSNGKVLFYSIRLPKNVLDNYPEIEKPLFNVVSALKEHGVREYDLEFSDKSKPGEFGFILRSIFQVINTNKEFP